MTVSPDVATGGLTELAVRARVDAGQVNTIPPAPGRSLAQILRANVLTRFNAILGALFVVVLVIGPPQDALFGVVLVVNTGIGVAQELRAKRALDRLAILTAGRTRAVRDGAVTEIPLDRIVIDDVLELGRGDQVPVDGTVLPAPTDSSWTRRCSPGKRNPCLSSPATPSYPAAPWWPAPAGSAPIASAAKPTPPGCRPRPGGSGWPGPRPRCPAPSQSVRSTRPRRPATARWRPRCTSKPGWPRPAGGPRCHPSSLLVAGAQQAQLTSAASALSGRLGAAIR